MVKLRNLPPTGSGWWEMLEVPSRLRFGEGQRRRRRNWVHAAVELPGVAEGDMLRQNGQRKHGTTSGSPRRTRTAKASHINRAAAKLRCAPEWGACGRISVDGLGQHNPDRSEGHWGRGNSSHSGCISSPSFPTRSGGQRFRPDARRTEAKQASRGVCRVQARANALEQ